MSYLDKELYHSRTNFIPQWLREFMFWIGHNIGYFLANLGQKIGERLYVLSVFVDHEETNDWIKKWDLGFYEDL